MRHLRKKLQQIEALEARATGGEALNAQQAFKVAQRPQVRSASSKTICLLVAAGVCQSDRKQQALLTLC